MSVGGQGIAPGEFWMLHPHSPALRYSLWTWAGGRLYIDGFELEKRPNQR
jgi:hypothetical protein